MNPLYQHRYSKDNCELCDEIQQGLLFAEIVPEHTGVNFLNDHMMSQEDIIRNAGRPAEETAEPDTSAEILFKKNCDFNNRKVIVKSPEVTIDFIDCGNTEEPPIEMDIEDEFYSTLDGPVEN